MRVEEAEVKGVEEVREAEVEAEVGREGRWRAVSRPFSSSVLSNCHTCTSSKFETIDESSWASTSRSYTCRVAV